MAEELNSEVDGFIIAEQRRQTEAARTPGTVEWAKNVELPPVWRPIKRLGALATYGAEFHLKQVGWSPLPQYMTRRDLIRTADVHERIELIKSLAYSDQPQAELQDPGAQ